jgi:hypothetical protein
MQMVNRCNWCKELMMIKFSIQENRKCNTDTVIWSAKQKQSCYFHYKAQSSPDGYRVVCVPVAIPVEPATKHEQIEFNLKYVLANTKAKSALLTQVKTFEFVIVGHQNCMTFKIAWYWVHTLRRTNHSLHIGLSFANDEHAFEHSASKHERL